ncbi:MAG TPA: hypothetical protein VK255_03755, partial [Patescibacteria group bacterium]|nr:hypothetical protein [Patescibacteria group bacterium]
GQSPLKMKDYGCTTTCISMASDWFKYFRNPGWMAQNLSYTKEGLILWNSISKQKELNFKFDWRYYGCLPKVIDSALKDPKQVCLLEIRKCHWVLALKKKFLSNNYIAADPWTGGKKEYSPSMITGCAVLEIK